MMLALVQGDLDNFCCDALMDFIWSIGMKDKMATSSWDTRPQRTELQRLIGEFGAALKEPDEQQVLWGYKWVLSYPGNELPLNEERSLWAHLGMYVQWKSDIALLCRHITAKYPGMALTERSSIRTWVEQGASWNDLPIALGTEVQSERLQPGEPWSNVWLDAARKHTLDPAFFGHSRAVDRLLEVIDGLDAQIEKSALDTVLPSGKFHDVSSARL